MASPMRGSSAAASTAPPPPPSSSSSTVPVAELASMLRKSADIVEHREFHPLLYQTMRALTAYAGEYAEGLINNSASSPPGVTVAPPSSQQQAKNSAFHDVPDDVLDSTPTAGISNGVSAGQRVPPTSSSSSVGGTTAAAERLVGAPPGEQLSRAAAPSGQSNQQQQHPTPRAPHKGVFSLKGIKKGIEKIGADVNKLVGETATSTTHHPHPHEKSNSRDDLPFDEYAWCDEHFTRGCHCKSLKNAAISSNSNHSSTAGTGGQHQNLQQQPQQLQQPSSSERTSLNANSNSNSNAVPELSSSSSKPCFQRPINPSSNLIANGWIDQQRRSKMRVVWKDVLASLVEGRRPGEETTLWIQRQVIDSTTGKVTGLEALHQIPMKWLEDVNYVDIYGDHQFTLKVYNISEEFYFRTRDELSAQSWVLTLRSARDSSLEGNVRMTGGGGPAVLGSGSNSGNNVAAEKNQTAKEMGLYNLEDGDNSGKHQPTSQGGGASSARGDGGESSTIPPQAGGDADARGDISSRPTTSLPSGQQQEQQTAIPTASSRMSIAELRAIAHGAGFNTRGMERQDLERIAAHIRNGAFNPNPTPTATQAPAPATTSARTHNTQQSMQKEAAMREAAMREAAMQESEQSAMAEKYEKEKAQKANEEARRQKEIEERIAYEQMRREREEYEKRRMAEQMADQQLRQQKEIELQASEIKRRQEEDRLRKMAELQQQQQLQQAQAAAERKKREEEEEFKRRQEEDRQRKIAAFQQQQAQTAAERRRREEEEQRRKQHQVPPGGAGIPSPPTSGGYPQNFQPQQQQPWQQQQPQHQHRPQQPQQNYQQQQQWQQQQQQQRPQQQHPQNFHQQGFPGQQQQPNQQQHPYHFSNQNTHHQGGQQQRPQQQQQPHFQHQQQPQPQPQPRPQPSDGKNAQGMPNLPSKYEQMEEKNGEPCSASTLQIKRSILINWALQPPNLNMLRPIDHLISTIHTAMPPAFGVAAHAYFTKFTPISQNELIAVASMGSHPDEEKLKKAVRKVRVFLHPDKLPRDLSHDQAFAARMLWDITSDSWEEFQKHKDELDWIRS